MPAKMYLKTIAPLLLAAAPAVVSAAGSLGFCLGDMTPANQCKKQQDWEDDMAAIKQNSGSTIVRTYSTSDCGTAANILPAAAKLGFKVILGMWPDTDASFTADKGNLTALNGQWSEQLYAITVGSETLYRGNFTGQQLLEKVNEVRAIAPEGTKIGTADSWNKFADGTADALIQGQGRPDILLVNGFAYWQGAPVNNATATFFDDMYQAFDHIQNIAGSTDAIELWTGETGWPGDGGTDYGPSIASTQNAATYWHSAVCGMLACGTNVFYFEAFDESQKPPTTGDNGLPQDEKHWGAMTDQRALKPGFPLTCN